MAKKTQQEADCQLAIAMNMIGGKWKIPILWYLAQSPQRYNQLKRCVGNITNTMLTRALRDLEEDGLIERAQQETIPPQVTYSITQKGNAVIPAIQSIQQWIETVGNGKVSSSR